MVTLNKMFVWLTKSSTASLTPVAARTIISGTAVASGLNAVILGMDCKERQQKWTYFKEQVKN